MRRFRGCTCTGYRRVSDERAAKAALAVAALVGEEAARGLSANVVSRLKRVWDEEYGDWCRRDLSDDWVYVWADGIHSGLRGDDGRLCVLVVIGVNARGDKHFLAIEDGVRESTQSWREVLLGMQQRGFTRPAKLAVGDGALGFWSALSEVYPQIRSQRCWMHKSGNVLNYFPKVEAHRWRDALAKAKQGLQEIWMAETRAQAERAFDDWIESGEGLRHAPHDALDDLQDGHECGDVLAAATRLPSARQGDRGREVPRRHRGHRGQQGRRMTNPPYTRFDNSSRRAG